MSNFFLALKLKIKKNKVLYFISVKVINYLRIIIGLNNPRSLIGNFIKEHNIKKELKSIKKMFKFKKNFNTIIVFDCKSSPPTLGDFFNVVMLARYFQKKKTNVFFYIIIGKYRKNWARFEKKDYNQHINVLLDISKKILNQNAKIEVLRWNKFLKKKIKNPYIVFKDRVLKRKHIYGYSFNIINYLCLQESTKFTNNFLLKKNDFLHLKNLKMPKEKYITVHCRYSEKERDNIFSKYNSSDRNLKRNEFIDLAEVLLQKFRNYKIMIVSDKIGCKYFKKISSEKKFNFLFSKNFSNSFIKDGALIINSKYYFQLWSGGMCVFIYYSKIPYVRCTNILDYDKPVSKTKLAYWHKSRHYLIENDRRDYSQFIQYIKNLSVN